MSALDDDDDAIGLIQSDESCRCFSLDEIQSATNNFDDALVIGSGGFGKVYKGFIDNGATTVAIKRLKAESNQGAEEFWTEVKMLSKLRHTHLVALIGHCNNCEEMMLVYEYMANGTLADHLYKLSRKQGGISIISHLTWEQRLDICLGAARGLDCLHTSTNQSFIHRDVKTTNILLDENWVAKISDFGLSKDTTSHSITHITTNVKGTFGYLDPDYFLTQRLTKKSDVYAFGVVLFEVLCGRPAVDRGLEEDQINLVFWAQRFIRKGKLDGIVDPSLSGQISPHCLKYFVKVASKCLHNLPKDRPTMAEVVRSLKLALESHVKRRTEGIITKVFLGIGMDHWWRERKDMNSTKSGPSKDSRWEPLPGERKDNSTKNGPSKDSRWEPFLGERKDNSTKSGPSKDSRREPLPGERKDNSTKNGPSKDSRWEPFLGERKDMNSTKNGPSKDSRWEPLPGERKDNSTKSGPSKDSRWKPLPGERKDMNSTKSGPSKDSLWEPLPGERKDMNSTKNGPSKESLPKPPSKSIVTQVHRRFSFAEIKAATNNFNERLLIGRSSSGKVYKCSMDGGTLVVAIKRHEEPTEPSMMTFESKIEVQSQLNHPHIVSFIESWYHKSFIGYLYSGPYVVFDYMVNGSLRDHLYGTNNDPLPWKKRLELCIGAARGLQHIHRVTNHTLAYDDINSSKILLDKNWVAKVMDFTWSWIKPNTNLERCSLFNQWNTNKWDIRSFGFVLFEVLCAKERCVPSVSCIQKGTIEIDPYLIGKIAPECLTKFVNIASTCFFNYNNCPSMDFVVESLEDTLELQEAWENRILE